MHSANFAKIHRAPIVAFARYYNVSVLEPEVAEFVETSQRLQAVHHVPVRKNHNNSNATTDLKTINPQTTWEYWSKQTIKNK